MLVCLIYQDIEVVMAHKPISIVNLSFELPHKVCFAGFNTQILPGDRIAIIGRNGTGKSSLVKMLLGEMDGTSGSIKGLEGVNIGYVPQTVLEHDNLSGGERFNKSFSEALACNPDVLILDEPTNHLDQNVKHSLLRKLDNYNGTLIIVSHDLDVLTHSVDKLWHIKDGKITVFSGNYDDYMSEQGIQLEARQHTLNELKKQKKQIKIEKQKEQQRLDKKRTIKDNNKMAFDGKADKNQLKSGAKIARLREQLEDVQNSMSKNRLPENLQPNFVLDSAYVSLSSTLVSVSLGACGYTIGSPIVSNIYFAMGAKDKVAINGSNGSGKTTFVRALMQMPGIVYDGDWQLPKRSDIGYVDQHYANLDLNSTVFQTIKDMNVFVTDQDIRKHLNSFLFRKNEEVFAKVGVLSGGEKARLSLAKIAAKPPKLLILDEISNNIDLDTKTYILNVLRQYPGAFVLISHEKAFINSLPLTAQYMIRNGLFMNQK